MVKEKLIRVFVSVEFPSEVVKEVARVQELLGKVKFTGKMTELENLHLTLKFLGEIDDDKIEIVRKRLREIKFDKMNLKLGRVGVFTKPKGKDDRGKMIIWVKVEGKEIYELQKKIDLALKGEFAVEDRFMGHLTIARIKYVKDKRGFLERLKSIHPKSIDFVVSEFKLKKSDLDRVGPKYEDLEVCKYRE